MKHKLLGLWHRSLRYAGPYGIAGVTLLMAAVLIAASIPRVQKQGQEIRIKVAAKSNNTPASSPATEVRRLPVDKQVSEFVAEFPLLSQNPSDLEVVFSSAKRRNIKLLHGEYQFKQDAKVPLVTYTATFPLSSDYGSIRDFTADVLRALPNASMDELRMNRRTAGSTVIESVIRFSFVYRRP
jgi:hypothetical protein